MKETEFCCPLFGEQLSAGGKRGMTIVPCRSLQHGDCFFLEFRGIAKEDEKVFNSEMVKVMIWTQQAIRFCPWCGANLTKFYRGKFDSLPFVIYENTYAAGVTSQDDVTAK